ncbi:hypothetical protein AB0N99_21180 [Streptomyces sp. NPDC093272]|uniref:DUF6907 domain-containing protein n=1 Tax=Streptomyces sp. NPDC093272 TaxID=3154981 RepID=UPI00342AC287
MSSLPTFGPSEVFPSDPAVTPVVVVRIAMELSLNELRAALGISHGELNGEPPLADMGVQEIRREVEGYLSAHVTIGTYRDVVDTVGRAAQNGTLPSIDAAIERAYTPRDAESAVQRPVYAAGRVELDTLDRGRVTIPEPRWCRGHDGEQVNDYVDLTHASAPVLADFDGNGFLPARISWAPFSAVQSDPLADVDEFPGMTPEQLRGLAAETGLHAGRLYSLANQLDRIRREAS